MNEEQYRNSMAIITYLWTIGVIRFDDAGRVIEQIQNYRALEIWKEHRRV
jgi:hypothetical protein